MGDTLKKGLAKLNADDFFLNFKFFFLRTVVNISKRDLCYLSANS